MAADLFNFYVLAKDLNLHVYPAGSLWKVFYPQQNKTQNTPPHNTWTAQRKEKRFQGKHKENRSQKAGISKLRTRHGREMLAGWVTLR